MTKTFAAATFVALFGVVGAANAADFYHGSLKDAPAFVPPPMWTGFYIGGHVGGAWGEFQNNWDFYMPGGWNVDSDSWKSSVDGFFGGGTAGYNYQMGAFVIGLEADLGAIGFSGTADHNGNWMTPNSTFYADVTGRLGYAIGPTLIYAKGGWAYLDNPITFGFYDYFGTSRTYDANSFYGWTIGGGVEYQFSPSWSVKAEYQYFNFGEQTYPYVFSDGESQRQTTDFTLNTFKVGVNYHLNNIFVPLK